MARSIWKGSISFGLVNIPVSLYSGEEKSEKLSFNMLDKRDMQPLGYKRVNKTTGEEVAWGDIVKAYEFEKGQYVVVEDEDFQKAYPVASQTVEILDFVDAAEIEPLYYDKPYFLAPDKRGAKPYSLLLQAMKATGRCALAKWAWRSKEYVVQVRPSEGGEAFRAHSVALDRTSYVAKASVMAALSSNAAVSIGYSGEVSPEYTQHEANIGFRIVW